MDKIFSEDSDWREILESGESLRVSKFIHKIAIEVDNKGSEASETNGNVVISVISLFTIDLSMFCCFEGPTSAEEPASHKFNVDHPFLYFVVDSVTKAMILRGRFTHF